MQKGADPQSTGSQGTSRAPPDLSTLHRAILASALGNATEWFDYGLYAYGLLYISAAIFPGSSSEAVLFALATFAISFVVRPFGGLVWGILGDRVGRKSILALTILLMTAATLAVGLVPDYQRIGALAPTLLILARIVQGFSTGGEYGGAATFMAEYAPDDRRGFYGSFLEFGTLAGFAGGALLMLGFTLVLGDDAMHAFGWRIPFLMAAPLGIVGLVLRYRMDETPVFAAEAARRKERPAPRERLFPDQWRPMLIVGGLVVALNVVNYTLLSYMPTYLERRIGLQPNEALFVPILGMLAMMVAQPFAGHLSDRVGRRAMWRWSLVGLTVAAIPAYLLVGTGFLGAMTGFAILGLLYVPQLATISATFPALFPTAQRYAGFAISYNVATSIFGGTAPMVASALISYTGDPFIPAYLMMAASAVGMVALRFMPETAGRPLAENPFRKGGER